MLGSPDTHNNIRYIQYIRYMKTMFLKDLVLFAILVIFKWNICSVRRGKICMKYASNMH